MRYFWASLEQMNQNQRSKFVQFVSARSRLPRAADEFSMNFKVRPKRTLCFHPTLQLRRVCAGQIVEPKPAAREAPDSHLPHSQTCFFTLSLPFYSSQEVCFRKLKYAIENATTMDDDFMNRETWGSN